MGHQEDLHGRYPLPEQVAGTRLHAIATFQTGFVFCFIFFFVQDSTSLPSITALASELEVNAKVTEDTRAAVEHFLQVRS